MGIFVVLTLFYSIAVLALLGIHLKHIYQVPNLLALNSAREQVYAYFIQNSQLPNDISLSFYKPFYEYTKSSDGTYALLQLFGRDKRKDTGDDIKTVFYTREILPFRYKEVYERARIIEQTAYALCQRRLAKNENPIWAPTLDKLFEWTDLPSFYKYTPFGDVYNYDVSSCKNDYCYCNKTIVWADDIK